MTDWVNKEGGGRRGRSWRGWRRTEIKTPKCGLTVPRASGKEIGKKMWGKVGCRGSEKEGGKAGKSKEHVMNANIHTLIYGTGTSTVFVSTLLTTLSGPGTCISVFAHVSKYASA